MAGPAVGTSNVGIRAIGSAIGEATNVNETSNLSLASLLSGDSHGGIQKFYTQYNFGKSKIHAMKHIDVRHRRSPRSGQVSPSSIAHPPTLSSNSHSSAKEQYSCEMCRV